MQPGRYGSVQMRARAKLGPFAGVAVGALLATSAVALAAPPPMKIASRGTKVTATQGSFCWHEPPPEVSICADSGYPLPVRCSLPVKRGAKLVVRTGTAATWVTCSAPHRRRSLGV